MAVTTNPYIHAPKMIEDHIEPSTIRESDVTSGLRPVRDADSNPNLHPPKDNSVRLHRHKKRRNRSTNVDESESLSDIDDMEVGGYLHNKREMEYKRIIWEAMNKDYAIARTRKRKAEPKKGTAKKVAKTTGEMDNEKRLSSKIDYDALKKLSEALELDSEIAEIKGKDSDSGDDIDSQSEKFSIEVHKSVENKCNEFEQNSNHSEDDDNYIRECDEKIYYGYEDEYGDGEDYNNDYED